MNKEFWDFTPHYQYPRAIMVKNLLEALDSEDYEKVCRFFQKKINAQNSPWYQKLFFNEKALFESLFNQDYEKFKHLVELKKSYFKPHPKEIIKKVNQIFKGKHKEEFYKIISYTYDLREENQDLPDDKCFKRALSHHYKNPAIQEYLKSA